MRARTHFVWIAPFSLCLGMMGPVASAQGQLQPLPRVIPYQGRLELAGNPFTGTRDVAFRFYVDGAECQRASSPLWSRTKTVDFNGGRFYVELEDDPASPDPAFDRLIRASQAFLSIELEDGDGNRVPLLGCQVLRPAPYAQRAGGDVPIGTVIDWYRPPGSSLELPAGYQLCDGTMVTDPRSPLNGSNTPNLVDRFVRAVADVASIGNVGGSDDLPEYPLAPHNHNWAWYDSANRTWFSFNGEGGSYRVCDYNDGFGGAGHGYFLLGIHGYPTESIYLYTDKSPDTLTTNLGDQATGRNVPGYVGLLKLIRIY